jgi:hypothetical protein
MQHYSKTMAFLLGFIESGVGSLGRHAGELSRERRMVLGINRCTCSKLDSQKVILIPITVQYFPTVEPSLMSEEL